MSKLFREYKNLDLPSINKEILSWWDEHNTFQQSIEIRKDSPSFIFYEGPPSANGTPGIHHVMARTIKDLFCRYKTMKGFRVDRKAGWDTHGLPVELGVEKALGIKKEDIGKKISVEEYNEHCRKDVMKYTDEWEELTRIMGYWVDMSDPYITYDNKYIESLWWLLKQLYEKGLLYKGYTIQPYSPAAGTGLSTHELNQPGCYRNVKDTSLTAQFKIIRNQDSEFLFEQTETDVFILAWTTTPWTLPSNTALAVGEGIEYAEILTFNSYTKQKITVVLAVDRIPVYFNEKGLTEDIDTFNEQSKIIPYKVLQTFKGERLSNIRYEQLIPWHKPANGDAFKVIIGDFVTTDDGTGIVHIAPSFGADDFRMAKQYGLASLTLVDKQGKFIEGCGHLSGRYVKQEYEENEEKASSDSVDVEIAIMLKKENKAFKIEKYEHSYPHCWRTDKPIIYYPLDSWFIKTTAFKQRMIELNKTINWQPPHTGSGRFGQWLENLVDWNLSRSRFWGTPLPIWATEDYSELKCIGSVAELKAEIEKAIEKGFMQHNPLREYKEGNYSKENYQTFDLHKPFVDEIVLVSTDGRPMRREPDLIDVWFDSGAMPYAQWHYPFEHAEDFNTLFPADFIAEGVDQTRGWFFTLHALSVMLFDSVAYKNIVSNGLVLDKNGNKMSKRLGNAIDPFEIIKQYGADVLRWYMITNSQPWENLKFDVDGLDEVKRKFFGTLYNTYSFFALYANIDGFTSHEPLIPYAERCEMDRWILSVLHSLIRNVETHYELYEPTEAGRLIQDFVIDHLSNWYVRLNRKRFWGGVMDTDKLSAYQTLYECLLTVSKLMAPLAPFYAEKLYQDLYRSRDNHTTSVHHALFPKANIEYIDAELEERMQLAQEITSLILSLRRKVNIKVRQPLSRVLIPSLSSEFVQKILSVKEIILAEVNVKSIEFVDINSGIIIKKVKPNYKILGSKLGKHIKELASRLNALTQQEIQEIEQTRKYRFENENEVFEISADELEILTQDMPGWQVASKGYITVALDVTITDELKYEGVARELINKIQNIRKESGLEVTDKIQIQIQKHDLIEKAIEKHGNYIATQTLASEIKLYDNLEQNSANYVEIDNNLEIQVKILKV
ncbi:MAG: isoleucine--tRNA ligase [Bacteroidales bacterium]|nr:isoleucine--tRNA ligase [Bacteroidales bacterium]